jgi:hypothetical protein
MRLGVVLAALAGCDQTLGLVDIQVKPDGGGGDAAGKPCSRFSTVDRVQFASPLVALSSFSVGPDDVHGAVFGKPDITATKPLVFVLSRASLTDPWMQAAGTSSLASAYSPQFAALDDLFVAVTDSASTLYDLAEYAQPAGLWTQVALVDMALDADSLPTGYITIGAMRVVVEVQRTLGGTSSRLSFRVDAQGTGAWVVEPQTPVQDSGNVQAAALSPDGLTMVYAASPPSSISGLDLYVTYRAALGDEFPVGTKIDLPGPDGEETEPALVDNDCSHLYFRRDTTISVAH